MSERARTSTYDKGGSNFCIISGLDADGAQFFVCGLDAALAGPVTVLQMGGPAR